MANGRNVTYGRNGRRLVGNNTFYVSADTSGLKAYLDQLGNRAKKAIRPAAQAAAQVIYDRIKVNVAAIGKVSGNLDRAVYQAYSPENSKAGQRAEYHMSWNHLTAPHGHLIEFGYLQRYRYYQDNQGRVRPMVRPGMEGQPRPSRRASQEEKNAYYVTLPVPKQIPGRAFMRSAVSAIPMAVQAAEDELIKRLLQKG